MASDGAGKRAEAAGAKGHAHYHHPARAQPDLEPIDHRIACHGADVVLVQTMEGGATRYHRRVQRPIDSMRVREALTDRQWSAADRLARDYALGPMGARDVDEGERIAGVRGAGGIDGYAVAQMDAVRAHRLAARALGLRLSAYVLPVVCADSTVAALAVRLDKRPECVAEGLRIGLDTLADHYGW